MKLAILWRIKSVCHTTMLMFSCNNSRVVNVILDLKCLFRLEKQITFYRSLIFWNTLYFSKHHAIVCFSENKRSFPLRHKVFLGISQFCEKLVYCRGVADVYMRSEMKYKRNEISFRHEKYFVYITFIAGEIKYNLVSGVFGMNQPIKKCKQTRVRYIDKHVRGNNAGIYYGTFMLNQRSAW